MDEPCPAERLDSWKEIAAYLRRGARTVQRWEREQRLPVHRLKHDKLGSVYAYKSELDAWWESRREIVESEPAPAEPSIAILPFADMSAERDQEYFCEGIAEEILAALSRIHGLRVASRSASFRFKPGSADLAEIGRALRVRDLLEGSVRKSGQRLRIGVRLTDSETGYQVWSETYDREARDIFEIQEQIASSVARALEMSLSPREKAGLAKSPTRDLQAYDCYLRGRKYFYGYGPRDMEFAIQLFTRAVGYDPACALAYAGLADCWSYLYLYACRDDAVRELAQWASDKAVELDPDSAQAHASRAVALSLAGGDAEPEFETALRLDPGLFEAHYFYARHAFAGGQPEKAVRLYEAAMRDRPEDYQSPLLCAQIYDDLGRPADARAARLRGIELAGQHLALNPDDARAYYMAANGMAALGQASRAKEWAARAIAMRPADGMLLYNVGCIYSLLGCCEEEALDCLEKAVEHGVTHRDWFERDNNLDPLRAHPRFQRLLAGLPGARAVAWQIRGQAT